MKFFTGNFERPPTSRVIHGVDQSKEGQIVIEKNEQGETRSRGFDLQPVVVKDDWRGTNITMATRRGDNTSSFVAEGDERGFGLQPVRDGKAFVGTLQNNSQDVVSSGDGAHLSFASGVLESRGLDLTPVVPSATEGRGFDLQPANDALGFSLQPATEARGMHLQPAVDSTSETAAGGRGYDLQPAQDGRGFSLQPVANLVESEGEGKDGEKEGGEEADEDEDTPPPESLQSIKNIARARKSAGRDSVKKSTETHATAKKTSKVGKEKSGKRGTTGEKPQQKKDKGKAGSSSVDKSHVFKPSPSSGPSWSPTPTMRSSKTKVRKFLLTRDAR